MAHRLYLGLIIALLASSGVPGTRPVATAVPGGQTIDFYLPDETDGSTPLVVLLHGGGDKGNAEMSPLAEALAGRGIVVAVPNYYSGQPRTRQDIEATFRDVVCSIRYARSRAADLGADPDNLTLVGFSYGGYPAMAIRLAASSCFSVISGLRLRFIRS